MYREYYDAKTSHRRLQWTYSLGQCNVKGTFGGGKRVFELQVTTLQAIVMLAFNKDRSCPGGVGGAPIPFAALLEAVGLPEDILKRLIHSLACGTLVSVCTGCLRCSALKGSLRCKRWLIVVERTGAALQCICCSPLSL